MAWPSSGGGAFGSQGNTFGNKSGGSANPFGGGAGAFGQSASGPFGGGGTATGAGPFGSQARGFSSGSNAGPFGSRDEKKGFGGEGAPGDSGPFGKRNAGGGRRSDGANPFGGSSLRGPMNAAQQDGNGRRQRQRGTGRGRGVQRALRGNSAPSDQPRDNPFGGRRGRPSAHQPNPFGGDQRSADNPFGGSSAPTQPDPFGRNNSQSAAGPFGGGAPSFGSTQPDQQPRFGQPSMQPSSGSSPFGGETRPTAQPFGGDGGPGFGRGKRGAQRDPFSGDRQPGDRESRGGFGGSRGRGRRRDYAGRGGPGDSEEISVDGGGFGQGRGRPLRGNYEAKEAAFSSRNDGPPAANRRPSPPRRTEGFNAGGADGAARFDTRKLIPCTFFLRGMCNKGDDCPFLHAPPSAPENPEERVEEPFVSANEFIPGVAAKPVQSDRMKKPTRPDAAKRMLGSAMQAVGTEGRERKAKAEYRVVLVRNLMCIRDNVTRLRLAIKSRFGNITDMHWNSDRMALVRMESAEVARAFVQAKGSFSVNAWSKGGDTEVVEIRPMIARAFDKYQNEEFWSKRNGKLVDGTMISMSTAAANAFVSSRATARKQEEMNEGPPSASAGVPASTRPSEKKQASPALAVKAKPSVSPIVRSSSQQQPIEKVEKLPPSLSISKPPIAVAATPAIVPKTAPTASVPKASTSSVARRAPETPISLGGSGLRRSDIDRSSLLAHAPPKLPVSLRGVNDTYETTSEHRLHGLCDTMCPPAEVEERQETQNLSQFEMRIGTTRLRKPVAQPELCIKAYIKLQRGADPENVRPLNVLITCMRHLFGPQDSLVNTARKQPVVDSDDVDRSVIYKFVDDRSRAIRQDLLVQNMYRLDVRVIPILEMMVRFHMLSSYQLSNLGPPTFDAPLNRKALSECMSALRAAYDLAHEMIAVYSADDDKMSVRELKRFLVGEAEFTAYDLLSNIDKIPSESLPPIMAKPWLLGSRPMKFALDVMATFNRNDYTRYLKMMHSCPSPAAACVMHSHLPKIRHHALIAIARERGKKLTMSLTMLQSRLGMETFEEAVRTCKQYRIKMLDSSSKEVVDVPQSPGRAERHAPLDAHALPDRESTYCQFDTFRADGVRPRTAYVMKCTELIEPVLTGHLMSDMCREAPALWSGDQVPSTPSMPSRVVSPKRASTVTPSFSTPSTPLTIKKVSPPSAVAKSTTPFTSKSPEEKTAPPAAALPAVDSVSKKTTPPQPQFVFPFSKVSPIPTAPTPSASATFPSPPKQAALDFSFGATSASAVPSETKPLFPSFRPEPVQPAAEPKGGSESSSKRKRSSEDEFSSVTLEADSAVDKRVKVSEEVVPLAQVDDVDDGEKQDVVATSASEASDIDEMAAEEEAWQEQQSALARMRWKTAIRSVLSTIQYQNQLTERLETVRQTLYASQLPTKAECAQQWFGGDVLGTGGMVTAALGGGDDVIFAAENPEAWDRLVFLRTALRSETRQQLTYEDTSSLTALSSLTRWHFSAYQEDDNSSEFVHEYLAHKFGVGEVETTAVRKIASHHTLLSIRAQLPSEDVDDLPSGRIVVLPIVDALRSRGDALPELDCAYYRDVIDEIGDSDLDSPVLFIVPVSLMPNESERDAKDLFETIGSLVEDSVLSSEARIVPLYDCRDAHMFDVMSTLSDPRHLLDILEVIVGRVVDNNRAMVDALNWLLDASVIHANDVAPCTFLPYGEILEVVLGCAAERLQERLAEDVSDAVMPSCQSSVYLRDVISVLHSVLIETAIRTHHYLETTVADPQEFETLCPLLGDLEAAICDAGSLMSALSQERKLSSTLPDAVWLASQVSHWKTLLDPILSSQHSKSTIDKLLQPITGSWEQFFFDAQMPGATHLHVVHNLYIFTAVQLCKVVLLNGSSSSPLVPLVGSFARLVSKNVGRISEIRDLVVAEFGYGGAVEEAISSIVETQLVASESFVAHVVESIQRPAGFSSLLSSNNRFQDTAVSMCSEMNSFSDRLSSWLES